MRLLMTSAGMCLAVCITLFSTEPVFAQEWRERVEERREERRDARRERREERRDARRDVFAAPEIDAAHGVAAIAVLGAALALVGERRRRRS